MNYKEICDNIPSWDPKSYFREQMKKWGACTVLITGNSRAGKSNMLKSILLHDKMLNYFDFIIVFSRTLLSGFYQSFIQSKLMFDEFDPEVIRSFIQLAIQKKAEGKRFRWLVILDDCVDARSKYSKEITDLFLCGRHFSCTVFYLVQKASLLSTAWITNVSCFLTMFAGSRNEKEYLASRIISDALDHNMTDKKKSEVERMAYVVQSQICQNYTSLVILPYEDVKIYKYKAPLMK